MLSLKHSVLKIRAVNMRGSIISAPNGFRVPYPCVRAPRSPLPFLHALLLYYLHRKQFVREEHTQFMLARSNGVRSMDNAPKGGWQERSIGA